MIHQPRTQSSSPLCLVCSLLLTLILTACTAAAPAPAQPTVTSIPSTEPPPAIPTPTAPPAAFEVVTPTPPPTLPASQASQFPLSEDGPFFRGRRSYAVPPNQTRGAGEIAITVWYPAIKPPDYPGSLAADAPIDPTGAPYPLLLTSSILGDEFASHLASHGFIVAGVNGQGPSVLVGEWVIDFPAAILSMLDFLADTPPPELAGAIDAEHSGVFGYSFGGYVTLMLAGARVDPQYLLEICAAGPQLGSSPVENVYIERVHKYFCDVTSRWDEFASHAGPALTTSDDGLWQPLTDPRIRAVMPMAPDASWLFGPRGLAAVDLPALMICGTRDTRETDYYAACVPTFESLGSQSKGLISFVDRGHGMVFESIPHARMAHFITAFFGHHLQGRDEYLDYYSQAFVEQFPDLAWGPYQQP